MVGLLFASQRSAARLALSSTSSKATTSSLRSFASASKVVSQSPALTSSSLASASRLNEKDVKTLAAAQKASFSSGLAQENASDRVSLDRARV